MEDKNMVSIIIEAINKEITWCKNPSEPPPGDIDSESFIKGLEQSIKIINLLKGE